MSDGVWDAVVVDALDQPAPPLPSTLDLAGPHHRGINVRPSKMTGIWPSLVLQYTDPSICWYAPRQQNSPMMSGSMEKTIQTLDAHAHTHTHVGSKQLRNPHVLSTRPSPSLAMVSTDVSGMRHVTLELFFICPVRGLLFLAEHPISQGPSASLFLWALLWREHYH